MTVTGQFQGDTGNRPLLDSSAAAQIADQAGRMMSEEAPIYAGPDPRRRAHAGTLKQGIKGRVVEDAEGHVAIEVTSDQPPELIAWLTQGTKGGALITRRGGSNRARLLFYNARGDKVFKREVRRGATKANDFISRGAERIEVMVGQMQQN